ncbi:hypothetical protein AFERRI_240042 [Acidithiobacillus ferrivorans]|uniref:Uncharacterized protein n=1 Tax=Acidithiobacillus ferrivorans TaxID=160808 RepID=A0A060UQX2_9PROT|nr:hypothetical protein AFERRI_240042 [Acidithiobacillus ferrivorans]
MDTVSIVILVDVGHEVDGVFLCQFVQLRWYVVARTDLAVGIKMYGMVLGVYGNIFHVEDVMQIVDKTFSLVLIEIKYVDGSVCSEIL